MPTAECSPLKGQGVGVEHESIVCVRGASEGNSARGSWKCIWTMGEWRAHVVVVPGFSPGHAVPFLDLAIRIAASGSIKVTILTIAYQVPKVWGDAIYGRWAPRLRAMHPGVELVPVSDGLYNGTVEGFHTCIREASEERFVAAFASDLAPLMAGAGAPPPCCIISDMLVGWTQSLAAKFDIPRYVMHIQPASNISVMLHVPALIAEGRLPLTEENKREPIEIPGFGFPVHPADLPTDLNDPATLKWGSYEFYLRMGRRAREAPIVLVNTFRELEENVLAALDELHSRATTDQQAFPKVIPIGPLLLPSDFPSPDSMVIEDHESEESAGVMKWLDMQPPRSVLYVAFGTLVNNARQETEEIAYGLEASEQTFLWSAGSLMKRPNAPPPPALAELLPPGFEERTRERGKIATFVVPQLRVLRHPACGAFLNHCGWNTVLESLSGGVPLIAWPRQFEQRMTARYLVDVAKVAAELLDGRTGFVGRGEIERVVRLVMQQEEGEVLRSRAGELKQIIATRYAYSNPNLDSLLAGFITQSSNKK